MIDALLVFAAVLIGIGSWVGAIWWAGRPRCRRMPRESLRLHCLCHGIEPPRWWEPIRLARRRLRRAMMGG